MASNVRTTAGTTIGVSASAPATYDAAGFGALTFTEIVEVTDFGDFGRVYDLVTHNPVAGRRTVKRKGNFNDGAVTLQLGRDASDAGQALCRTALDDDSSYYFDITLQDGTDLYFSAQVMSFPYGLGNGNSITGGTITLEIDDDIIEVAP